MKNGEQITAEQLGKIDQTLQVHNGKQLISGKLTLKEWKEKVYNLDRIFKHQLYLIMTRDASNEIQRESPRETGE